MRSSLVLDSPSSSNYEVNQGSNQFQVIPNAASTNTEQLNLNFAVDTFVKNDYKRLLRNSATDALIYDLKAFIEMRKLGMKEYKHFIADFKCTRFKNVDDMLVRFWLQLTLVMERSGAVDKPQLQLSHEFGIFELELFNTKFSVKGKFPKHTEDAHTCTYPGLIFTVIE